MQKAYCFSLIISNLKVTAQPEVLKCTDAAVCRVLLGSFIGCLESSIECVLYALNSNSTHNFSSWLQSWETVGQTIVFRN